MKTKLKKISAALLIASSALIGTSAVTQAQGNAHMSVAGRTLTPIGHAMFCQQLPQECAIRSQNSKAPKLTRKRWAQMVSINSQVNNEVKPVTDNEYYGVEEHWTYPDQYGDCEDYVLLKRYNLIQQGWPESSLLITVVTQPNGDGHAVLTVRTDRADYVLDNLDGKIKQWNETPYTYLKRQSTKHSGKWIKIRDNRSNVAGN